MRIVQETSSCLFLGNCVVWQRQTFHIRSGSLRLANTQSLKDKIGLAWRRKISFMLLPSLSHLRTISYVCSASTRLPGPVTAWREPWCAFGGQSTTHTSLPTKRHKVGTVVNLLRSSSMHENAKDSPYLLCRAIIKIEPCNPSPKSESSIFRPISVFLEKANNSSRVRRSPKHQNTMLRHLLFDTPRDFHRDAEYKNIHAYTIMFPPSEPLPGSAKLAGCNGPCVRASGKRIKAHPKSSESPEFFAYTSSIRTWQLPITYLPTYFYGYVPDKRVF